MLERKLASSMACVLLAGFAVTNGGFPVEAKPNVTTQPTVVATPEQITEQIADKYQIGEKISEQDLQLIKTYSKPITRAEGITPDADAEPHYWSIKGSNANSLFTASLSGNVYVGLNLWENNFRGTLTTNVTQGRPTQYKTSIRMVAFGIIGTSGTYIGKTADFEVTSDWTSSSSSSYTYTFNAPFSASVAYYYLYPKSSVKNSYGAMEISGDGTKK